MIARSTLADGSSVSADRQARKCTVGVAIARAGAVHDRFPQKVAACNRVGRLALHGNDQCRCVGGVTYFPVATGVPAALALISSSWDAGSTHYGKLASLGKAGLVGVLKSA